MRYFVVIVVISLFLYCIFKTYSSIGLSSRKCVINSVRIVLHRIWSRIFDTTSHFQYDGHNVRRPLVAAYAAACSSIHRLPASPPSGCLLP